MTQSADGPFTFSNHPAMAPARGSPERQPPRPKANPQWIMRNRPTLELPEPDQPPPPPRHFHPDSYRPEPVAPPPALNNVDLIEHAFSTPTSTTPLGPGYASSGTETPLLGLAGFGFVTEKERDEQYADLNRIFDKISMHEQKSRTPDVKSAKKVDKRVSFDVQSPPSPLSATTADNLRRAHTQVEKPSVWETAVDNEDQILENMHIAHDAPTFQDTQEQCTPLGAPDNRSGHSATVPLVDRTFAAARPRSPNTATLPYFTTAYPSSQRAKSPDSYAHQQPGMMPGYGGMSHPMYAQMQPGHQHPPMYQQMPPANFVVSDGQQGYAPPAGYHEAKPHTPTKPMMPLTCFACRGVGHKATQCPTHPRPVVATSSADVIVNCAIHGKPRTSKNMFFNNKLGVWQCFAETECKSMLN